MLETCSHCGRRVSSADIIEGGCRVCEYLGDRKGIDGAAATPSTIEVPNRLRFAVGIAAVVVGILALFVGSLPW